ncbi:hypothetical protein I4U23_031364 [Adineta vaga]|nr:hypothetical protein I4U23_031364 [Adineta vaga]
MNGMDGDGGMDGWRNGGMDGMEWNGWTWMRKGMEWMDGWMEEWMEGMDGWSI